MTKNYNGSYWPREIRAILAGDATDNFLLLDLCYIMFTKKIKGKKVGQGRGKA